MKAIITKVANGYTAQINDHTYVGMNCNDIMKILINEPASLVHGTLNKEGMECQITIVITTKTE